MNTHPPIAPGDWIEVGNASCVFKLGSPSGVCKVVFNKAKPTTHDVEWDGTKWFFPQRPDFGGYGREGDKFVQILKHGR